MSRLKQLPQKLGKDWQILKEQWAAYTQYLRDYTIPEFRDAVKSGDVLEALHKSSDFFKELIDNAPKVALYLVLYVIIPWGIWGWMV